MIRDAALAALCAILICIALPLMVAGTVLPEEQAVPSTSLPAETEPITQESYETPMQREAPPKTEAVIAPIKVSFDHRFRLPVLSDGETVSMELYTYVLGAVLGEMPASFETEALKAQAVACRTYALRRYLHRKHDPAAVCTDSGCCMNWVDPEEYAAANGEATLARAVQAVEETDGMVIYYQDELIDATFFSCSGGRTESAFAVWGSDIPYLQAVDSPQEDAPYETDVKHVSAESFRESLLEANEMAVFGEDPAEWFGSVERTDGGGVAQIELGGCIYTGTQLRRLFSLRSTAFTVSYEDGEIIFTTHGYGHRVGMSQYGANAMARQGADYIRILTWYYSGTEVRDA